MKVTKVSIPVSRVYTMTREAWEKSPRYLSSCGGTRSGKTYSILQLLWRLSMLDKTPTITSVVSETMPHLKRGAIRDFKAILGEWWDDNAWNKTDCIYTFPNGSIIEFFSADSPAKVHGPARDRLFINEAQNISYEIARQLFVRTKGQIIIDYNPTHSFWVNEKIEVLDNCIRVHSTYKDNQRFLTPEQVAEIESNRGDANWWRVYGEGKVGVLEGIIYDFEQIDALPSVDGMVEVYGMDFGFTHDPTVLIHCLIHTGRKEIYLDEEFYQRRMLNEDIASAMESANVGRTVPVYADCADPKTIEELYQRGFNVLECYKATRKAEQIQALKGFRMFVTKRSVNTIRELRGYVWAQDKDGNNLNEPIKINDHAMDAFRYGVMTYIYEGCGRTILGFSSDYGD